MEDQHTLPVAASSSTTLPAFGKHSVRLARDGGAGDGRGRLTHPTQVNLLLPGVEMELTVGKEEEYVGDRGRAREGRAKQRGASE